MSEQNIPAPSPAPAGQGSGAAPQGQQSNSPAGNQPSGAQNEIILPDGTKMPIAEFNELKRKAGRFDADHKPGARRAQRQEARRKSDPDNGDDDDPGVIARDETIRQLSTENEQLKVKQSVAEVLQRDEYKDVPKYLKEMIARRPHGFVNETSRTIEDKVMDIEDFLDDYLDEAASNGSATIPPKGTVKEEKPDEKQIPPANGSGPASPNSAADIDVRGKTGPARSTAILQNLLKNRK